MAGSIATMCFSESHPGLKNNKVSLKPYTMKKIRSFRNWMTSALVISSLTMCHKKDTETNPAPQQGVSVEAVAACTYTITTSQQVVDGSTIPAGATVCVQAGTRGALLLKNFNGTASNPITIINKGGKVVFTGSLSVPYGLKTSHCSHIKVLGTGDPSIKYGFEVNGTHVGRAYDDLSTDFEVANVEIHGTGFAGVFAKTDPTCDPATQRGNFVMQNISLHDNYIHDTGGEGFYIGNSFFANGHNVSPCGMVLPHEIWGCRVYNNITLRTGCEGIQVGCATKGCEIFDNSVTSPGQTPFADAQNNGIQMGEGTGGKCYNNIVKNSPGVGIIILGLGDNLVCNNFILNSGAYGIFADSRYTPDNNFKFINNTIITTGGDGIRLYSETIPMNTVINNVIIKPGSGIPIYKRSNNVKLTASNNYVNNDVTTCKFVNCSSSDYHLNSGSPLINAGANVSAYGVVDDYYGIRRPAGAAYDIGATEYGAATAPSPAPSPAPTPSGGTLSISSFTLINAATGQAIGTVTNGETIDLSKLGTNKLSVRANTNPGTVGSVVFGYDSRTSFHTENGTAPYSFMGDYSNGAYVAWIPSLGTHTITGTPYSGANAGGTKGVSSSITLKVVSSSNTTSTSPSNTSSSSGSSASTSTAPQLSVESFTLINAVTGQTIGPLSNGQTIDLAKIGTNKLSVRANTNPGTVGSVIFGYDSRPSFKTENGTAPYTLMGDYPNGVYVAWIPSLGTHTITATPYSGANGSGTKGGGQTITIYVK